MLTIIAITIGVVFVLLIVALLIWVILTNTATQKHLAAQAKAMELLQQQLEALRTAQTGVSESLQKSLRNSQDNVSRGLQQQQQALSQLHNQLGQLHAANKHMLQMGSEVRRLQDILQSPKLRGQLGEWSLENLLQTILPADSYKLQHHLKDGKIADALIQMPGQSVCIDAKFPLPSFEAMLKTENEDEKIRLRKQFQRDVIKHVDKIAADYIRPAEGTLDFALMYIPAENVYYETVVKHKTDTNDILKYALDKRVILISPNLLYAYLMTIVMGLHGLQIEKQAEEILQNLKKLNASFAAFGGTWDILGKHLRNAQSQYEEGNSKFNRFAMQLSQIQSPPALTDNNPDD